MEKAKALEKKERLDGVEIYSAVSVELYNGGRQGLLSGELRENPVFLDEARERRELDGLLRQLWEKLGDPTMDVNEGAWQGKLSEEEIGEVYTKLREFIEADDNRSRLILYLPFSLFPKYDEEKTLGGVPRQEQLEFFELVRERWYALLDESDVRASFLDGDILEPGMGEPARVRKAGHLVPFLLDSRVLREDEVESELRKAREDGDFELEKSIEEGVAVWRKWAGEDNKVTEVDLLEELAEKLRGIDKKFSPGSEYVSKVSPKRIVWEKRRDREEVLTKTARKMASRNITFNETTLKKDGLSGDEIKVLQIKVALYSIEDRVINKRDLDHDSVRDLVEMVRSAFLEGEGEVSEEAESAIVQLKRMGVDLDGLADELKIDIRDLSLPEPVGGEEVLRVYGALAEAVKVIEQDEELSKYICPFFIAIGSQVKGIAGKNSDIDAALFWKPGVGSEDRESVLRKLGEKCPEIKSIDRMPEIWLDNKNGKYGFRQGKDEEPNSVSPEQIHFIFGGMWIGNDEEMKTVRADLVDSYVDLSRLGEDESEARRHLLRRLEMDALQYRLMHKGFRKYYPQRNNKEKFGEIDYESDFYEPEYRQIASLLYLSKVFLPAINLVQKSAD